MTSKMKEGKEKWVKNLYTKTGLPDNFTPDDCFLAAIQRNKNVRGHTFSECLVAACQVNMQLCAVFIFAVAYVFLVRKLFSREFGKCCNSN